MARLFTRMATLAQTARPLLSRTVVPKLSNHLRYMSDKGEATEEVERSKTSRKFPTSFHKDPIEPPKFEEIQERVMKICLGYDKIDSSKLQLVSHFTDDLGLDSLDHVEIMMEMEEEFGFEISDQDAEKLHRPVEIARYVFEKETERRVVRPDERKF